MPTITVVPVLDEEILAIGRRYIPSGYSLETVPKEELPGRIADVEYLLGMLPGWIDDDVLARAKKLKLIQLLNVGYDDVNVEGARKAGIPIALNGGANAISVAEHTVMFVLALLKRLKALDAHVRAGKWRGAPRVHEVWSQTVGIVGMGRIGQEVAKRLRPFDPAEIVYYDPIRPPPDREAALGVRYLPLDELLGTADIISLHVPLMPETRNMIDARALGLMKRESVIVNTSRGGLIDEAALAEALERGTIAGAGLDVFSQEPPPADHPLFKLKNILLTPHMAGPTWESWPRRFKNCFENIERVAAGQDPQWVIPELAELVPARR